MLKHVSFQGTFKYVWQYTSVRGHALIKIMWRSESKLNSYAIFKGKCKWCPTGRKPEPWKATFQTKFLETGTNHIFILFIIITFCKRKHSAPMIVNIRLKKRSKVCCKYSKHKSPDNNTNKYFSYCTVTTVLITPQKMSYDVDYLVQYLCVILATPAL